MVSNLVGLYVGVTLITWISKQSPLRNTIVNRIH